MKKDSDDQGLITVICFTLFLLFLAILAKAYLPDPYTDSLRAKTQDGRSVILYRDHTWVWDQIAKPQSPPKQQSRPIKQSDNLLQK